MGGIHCYINRSLPRRVALLDPKNEKLGLGCGITIIIAGVVQLFLECHNKCFKEGYESSSKNNDQFLNLILLIYS